MDFGQIRGELLRHLDVAQGDIDLSALLVGIRAISKRPCRARVDLDRLVEVGKRLVGAFSQHVGEAALGEGPCVLRGELRRLREIRDGGGGVAHGEVGSAAQQVAVHVACIEGDGAGKILDRLIEFLNGEPSLGHVAIGGGKARVRLYGAREVADRGVGAAGRKMRQAAPGQGCRVRRHQLHRAGVVRHRGLGLAEPHLGAGAIVVGGGITRCEHERAIEILDRLLGEPKRQQEIAAIVVDGGEFGKELDGKVEILERLPRVAELDIGDAAIVEDGRAPVVREGGVLERLGIAVDGGLRFAADERTRPLLRNLRGLRRRGERRDAEARSLERQRQGDANRNSISGAQSGHCPLRGHGDRHHKPWPGGPSPESGQPVNNTPFWRKAVAAVHPPRTGGFPHLAYVAQTQGCPR